MAKDILYIAQGSAVNAAWTEFIAISSDGTNWDLINRVGLTVTKHGISLNTSSSNSYPEANKESGFVIVIKRSDEQGNILKFNPEKVLNQAGWTASTPSVNALAAVADIATWISA